MLFFSIDNPVPKTGSGAGNEIYWAEIEDVKELLK